MAAARYSSDVLQMFYGPIPEEENNCKLSEDIQSLPPNLQEIIWLYLGVRTCETHG